MTQEQRHAIFMAKKEIGWFSCLANAFNNQTIKKLDWETVKNEFKMRGCLLGDDTEDNDDNHKQIDIFGDFCNFTLCWDKQYGYYINYGWVIDDRNTDLYSHHLGDFRPYYDERTKKEWFTEARG